MSNQGAAAGAAPRPLAWAVLERAAVFVKPGSEALRCGVEYDLHPKLAVPNLCTLRLSRALLAGDEDDTEVVAYVESADANGDILVSVWSPGAVAPRLLVCRGGTGKVDSLPGVLESEFGAASTGILPTAGGQGHYKVVQLQRAAPGSPSSSASSTKALCFCSASQTWTWAAPAHPRRFHFEWLSDEVETSRVNVVVGQHVHPVFEPHTVVGYGHDMLAFVDLKHRLLLLLDPAAPAAATTLPLPSPEEDGHAAADEDDEWKAATRCFVAWTQGSLSVLQLATDGCLVMHRLEEELEEWVRCFHVPRERIIWSDATVGLRLADAMAAKEGFSDVGVGPVDPGNRNHICFFSFDASVAFTVEVDPAKSSARFCRKEDVTSCGTNLHVLSCLLVDVADDPAEAGAPITTTWRQSLKHTGKRLGNQAWHAFNLARKHVHRIPPVAKVGGAVGMLLAVPYAPAVAGAVAGLAVLDQAVTAGEEFLDWWTKPRPTAKDSIFVGTPEEAARAICDWILKDKPAGMLLYPAPGASKEEAAAIRNLVLTQGAGQLLPLPTVPVPLDDDDDGYDLVGSALPHFWSD
ncbi:unnamed protein product [Urochloa decumbens]|uniref:DUF1618 domain-containing protein n=1 Tax=Urochloa decumbens TaxID=240449 RepID=A0ABC9B490_9POAL